MTVMKNTAMESILLDFSFEDEEPQNSSSVLGDQMDYGTFGDLSDAYLTDICNGSDLILRNPLLNTTTTNREGISISHVHYESLADQNPEFSFDKKISSPSYADYLYSGQLDKYLFEEQEFPTLLNCENFMKSPLSSEDVDSILDTTSLSDYGDINLSPLGSPIPSPEIALPSEDSPISSSQPSPLLVAIDESDSAQASNSVIELPLGYAVTEEEPSRSGSPPLLVSVLGKEKRTKSYRTKKNPYSWDKGTESIPSLIDILDQPQPLSKKEKKKLQNKNAATRYRQKMKEETEQRKQEEDELLKENIRLKKNVEEIQREIQYLKNLQAEINKYRIKL